MSALPSRRETLLAAMKLAREQLRFLNRELYPNYKHLFWQTVRVSDVDIDCQCELIDEDYLEIRCAMVDGADITKLAEKLGLDDLVNDQWVRA